MKYVRPRRRPTAAGSGSSATCPSGSGCGKQPVREPRAADVDAAGRCRRSMTAKIVIASAERLMPVRQFWRNRNRMAEISVPAWPIPTQKTKLVMSNAQPTGCC